jgi:hypothetical protein
VVTGSQSDGHCGHKIFKKRYTVAKFLLLKQDRLSLNIILRRGHNGRQKRDAACGALGSSSKVAQKGTRLCHVNVSETFRMIGFDSFNNIDRKMTPMQIGSGWGSLPLKTYDSG